VDVAPDVTELVVSEGGVYDNPMIEEPPVIAIGETLTFKDVIRPEDMRLENYNTNGYFYFYKDAEVGCAMRMSANPESSNDMYINVTFPTAEYEYFGPKEAILNMSNYTGITGAGWYDRHSENHPYTGEYIKLDTPPSFTVLTEEFINSGFLGTIPLKKVANIFKSGVYRPIDGWNKVTVNISAPVVTELTATKNGVYDNPIIEEPPIVEEGELMQFRESIVLSSEAISYLKTFNNSLLYKSGRELTH
jgi:hypothetical protein